MDTIDISFVPLDMQDLHTIVTNNFEFTRKDCDNLLLTIQVQLDLEVGDKVEFKGNEENYNICYVYAWMNVILHCKFA